MPHRDPFGPMRAGLAFWTMMAEAQAVVAIRTMGMWGVLPAAPSERHDMLAEKGPAFLESAFAAGQAAVMGKTAVQVAEAALRPIGRQTRSNVRRLTKPRG